MKLIQLPLTLILFALASTTAFAWGTLETSDVLAIIRQNEVLYKSLTAAFEFGDAAVGNRIGNVGDAHLGGARVAPYEFSAKPKGSKGPWLFNIIVEAETKYYRKSGEEVTLYEGEIIKEKLTSVKIVPMDLTGK